MATIQDQIAEKFLEKIASSGDIDAHKVAKLRALMAKKKIKPDDIVEIFTSSAGNGLK